MPVKLLNGDNLVTADGGRIIFYTDRSTTRPIPTAQPFNYQNVKDTVDTLFSRFGRSVSFTRKTVLNTKGKPWKKAMTMKSTYGAFVIKTPPPSERFVDNPGYSETTDFKVSTQNPVLIGDEFMFGVKTYTVSKVTAVSPAGLDLLYDIEVEK